MFIIFGTIRLQNQNLNHCVTPRRPPITEGHPLVNASGILPEHHPISTVYVPSLSSASCFFSCHPFDVLSQD